MLSEFLPADIAPFAGLSAAAIAVVFASHFFGFFIRGAFGFGSNLPVVLLTTWSLGPHHAILLVLMMTVLAQFHLLPQGLRTADWAVTKPLVIGMIGGGALGTWLFTALGTDWLTLVMGLLIAAILIMDHLALLERLGRVIDLRSRTVTSGLAAISGAVGSVSGGGAIYFLVVYLRLACATPALLRGTNVVLSAFLMATRIVLVAAAGLISAPLLAEAALLLPVVLLGTWTGTRYFHSVSTARFQAALQLLLICAALAIIAKGIARIA